MRESTKQYQGRWGKGYTKTAINEAVKLTSKNHDKAPNEMRDNNVMVENAE